MSNGDLLAEFSSGDTAHFKKDFFQMMKVAAEIDRYWGEANRDLDSYVPKFEKLIEQFNKKYKGLRIKTKKSIGNYGTRIFVKSRNVKEFFAESASRIPGLKSIGRTAFNQAEANDAEKFARFLDSVMDKVFITYADNENGTSSFSAVLDRQQKMVELIYTIPEILSESSAVFRVSAFYALKGGFDKKIDVYGNASTFGFFNLLNEIEKREWHDRFNPKYLES